MVKYISTPEAAKKRTISERRAQNSYGETRIPGTARFSRMRLIMKVPHWKLIPSGQMEHTIWLFWTYRSPMVPTSGKVMIGGKDIFSMSDRKLTIFRRSNIGFIFQAFNLIPELTVEQNIIFPVLLDYQKPDERYLEELLAILNLKERCNHLPSQLSGGQQQRVAIGRAR